VDARALQAASRTTRQARSDAEASADRLNDEPSRPPMTARLAYSLTGIGRRMAHTSLTLQAALESTPARAPAQPAPAGTDGTAGTNGTVQANGVARMNGVVAATDRFADGIQTAAQVIGGSLRSLRPPSDMPPLREMQTVLYEQLTGPGKTPLVGLDTVLAGATDEFTDALDSAADILHRQLGNAVTGAGHEDPDVSRPGRTGRDDPHPAADGGRTA
jgi:hypothetical protein